MLPPLCLKVWNPAGPELLTMVMIYALNVIFVDEVRSMLMRFAPG